MLTAEQKTAFKLLGVSPSDDAATIRRAWRALVRTYHPDQFRGDKAGANARLAELNAAYDVVEAFRPSNTVTADARSPETAARGARAKAKAAQARAQARQKTERPKTRAQSKHTTPKQQKAPGRTAYCPTPSRPHSTAVKASFGFAAAKQAMSLAAQNGAIADIVA